MLSHSVVSDSATLWIASQQAPLSMGILQARIEIGRRNINNIRYMDDTTLMAESEEELKSLLMRVKEES